MIKRKSSQSGFSLVELLVAVVILAIGLLGLAELQISAIKTNAHSDSITVSNGIAQKVVEEIAAMSAEEALFSTPATGATWTGSPYTVQGAGVYNVTYDVETNLDDVTGLSKITVYVGSANTIASVLGNHKREVNLITFKRSF